jgi:hypothetical protein
MLGSRVIMAMRGSNYSETDGLTISSDETLPVATIQEFVVNDTYRDFVHWQTPYVYKRKYQGDINLTTTEDGCYTVLTFDVHYIAGTHLNESGIDTFVWAANDVDSYMLHHGPNRGTFTIDWSELEQLSGSDSGSGKSKESRGSGKSTSQSPAVSTNARTLLVALLGACLLSLSL